MVGRRWTSATAVVAAAVIAGCGNGIDDLTVEQQLEKVAGRDLTTGEVAEQLATADLMCDFDGRFLNEIWLRLDARQLEFQDYVFGQHCPERLSLLVDARPSTGEVDPEATTTSTTSVGKNPDRSPNTTAQDRARTTTTPTADDGSVSSTPPPTTTARSTTSTTVRATTGTSLTSDDG